MITTVAIKDSGDNFMVSKAGGRGFEKSRELVRVQSEIWRRTTKVDSVPHFILIQACAAVRCCAPSERLWKFQGVSGQLYFIQGSRDYQ